MRILYLSSMPGETNGWGRYAAGFLAEARRRNGAENVVAPEPESLRSRRLALVQILHAAADAFRLRRQAASCGLIHAVTEPMAPLAMALSLMTRKPYVISVHGTYGDMMSYKPSQRWLYRLAFRRAAALAPVSSYTAAILGKQFPAARIEVISGGFAPGETAPWAKPVGRNVLSVGELKPRKGFHTLLRAVGRLKRDGYDCHVRIVGTPLTHSYPEELRRIIREEAIDDRAEILGRISEGDLKRRYAEADLFVLASEHEGSAFEGLGLVYLEALSHGIPVIGARDCGAEDVIRDGQNGLLVKPGDVEGLAKAIRSVFDHAETWRGKTADLVRSVDAFRWDAVGAKMMKLYESVAGNIR